MTKSQNMLWSEVIETAMSLRRQRGYAYPRGTKQAALRRASRAYAKELIPWCKTGAVVETLSDFLRISEKRPA